MPKSMPKANILRELSDKTGVQKNDISKVMDALTEIVYREAVNGITIPGLCKFTVVRRKESRRWNPALKRRILIAEHNTLKVAPIKKARTAIAPRPENMIQILPEEPVRAKPPEPKPAPAAEPDINVKPAPEPGASPRPSAPQAESPRPAIPAKPAGDDLGNILFTCPQCKHSVMAEAGQGGMTGECPTCHALIKIPAYDRKASEASVASKPSLKPKVASGPTGMPNVDRRSVTIRMDVSDFGN